LIAKARGEDVTPAATGGTSSRPPTPTCTARASNYMNDAEILAEFDEAGLLAEEED
jgi:hypothetical protein